MAVGEGRYLGPAAAHLPLYLVDRLLWSSDGAAGPYRGFQDETARYSLPRWRTLFQQQEGRPSLTTRVLAALRAAPDDPGDRLRAGAQALGAIYRTLIVFRGRHLTLVRGAYREDVRLYDVGSGGASVELVTQILQLTRDYAHLLAPPAPGACPHRSCQSTAAAYAQ